MISFKTLFLFIRGIDFKIFYFLHVFRANFDNTCFLAVTQKVIGVYEKFWYILILLIKSFNLSYIWVMCVEFKTH